MDYLKLNKKAWDERTPIHLRSKFYNLPGFIRGETSLQEIELEELKNVSGKSLCHLQCHFGQDTISWARLGAKVTGVDFSKVSINKAKGLAKDIGIDAQFIESDIYSLPQLKLPKYDIVYTSYGTIEWLPDITRWARVVASLLKPGGQFYMAEFHPYYSWGSGNKYFRPDPQIHEVRTYTDDPSNSRQKICVWPHRVSDVISALAAQGLTIKTFTEYPYCPYPCFPGLTEKEPGRYFPKSEGLPMVYTLRAEAPLKARSGTRRITRNT